MADRSTSTDQSSKPAKTRGAVGLVGLTAISISAMVGGGIYNLPGALAAQAGPAASLIAWLITGVGMWFVVNTFRVLSAVHPELTNGIYTYAERGFGRLVGWIVAFGYWMCSCCAMATYGVLLMATLSALIPVMGAGNTVPALIGASIVVWAVYFLARRGVEQASVVNVVGTVAKIVPVIIFLVICVACFSTATMAEDFYGALPKEVLQLHGDARPVASIMEQVSNAMLVTLWVFIGVEGAVVVSAEAKSQRTVATATAIAFLGTLALYILVSLVPFGSYGQGALANMSAPSTAAVLEGLVGPWGRGLISFGISISILSSWLVWMVMQGQMPTYAAHDGLFPALFKERNRFGAPQNSLLWSAIGAEIFLFVACFAGGSMWDTMVSITGVMVLPAYLVGCLYLVKVAVTQEWPKIRYRRPYGLVTGILGVAFGLWLFWSAGERLILACVIFALGTPIFLFSSRADGSRATLTKGEKVGLVILWCLGAASLVAMVTGLV